MIYEVRIPIYIAVETESEKEALVKALELVPARGVKFDPGEVTVTSDEAVAYG